MPGFSSASQMFARNSNMAKRVAGGLHSASNRVGGMGVPGARSASTALRMMGNYPRRTVGGAAAGLGAMGAYGGSRRRGSQNYPMY